MEDDEARCSTGEASTQRRRSKKLYSHETTPQIFSPSGDEREKEEPASKKQAASSTCKPSANHRRERSPSGDGGGGGGGGCGDLDGGRGPFPPSVGLDVKESNSREERGTRRREKFDEAVCSSMTHEEEAHFLNLRERLDNAIF